GEPGCRRDRRFAALAGTVRDRWCRRDRRGLHGDLLWTGCPVRRSPWNVSVEGRRRNVIALRMLALINGYGVPGGRCQPASGVGKAGDLQDGVAQLRLDVVEAGDITSEKSFEAVVEEIVGPAFLQVRSLRVGF